jgi:hypothetical protein
MATDPEAYGELAAAMPLTEQEFDLLAAFRVAPEWKKERIGALCGLCVHVLRGRDAELIAEVARLFESAPASVPLPKLMREAWRLASRND